MADAGADEKNRKTNGSWHPKAVASRVTETSQNTKSKTCAGDFSLPGRVWREANAYSKFVSKGSEPVEDKGTNTLGTNTNV